MWNTVETAFISERANSDSENVICFLLLLIQNSQKDTHGWWLSKKLYFGWLWTNSHIRNKMLFWF